MNFEHFFGGDGSATGPSSSNTAVSSETTQNQNQNRSGNAVIEGSGAPADDGIEDASVTEEQFIQLLMYRVKLGWSD
jgi:hypothetical protein